uniref:Integrase catalytic domain-containing protein n=1 Tax=Strongyloides stercoralis TaxID=6248 RepID=A0AAF5I2Y7_STRER
MANSAILVNDDNFYNKVFYSEDNTYSPIDETPRYYLYLESVLITVHTSAEKTVIADYVELITDDIIHCSKASIGFIAAKLLKKMVANNPEKFNETAYVIPFHVIGTLEKPIPLDYGVMHCSVTERIIRIKNGNSKVNETALRIAVSECKGKFKEKRNLWIFSK